MGIKGLYWYMNDNFKDWEMLSLEIDGTCSLVIDGGALSYHATDNCDLRWLHGGNYAALEKTLDDFLESLFLRSNGPVHVVFDGIDPSGEKGETIIQRKEDRLRRTIEAVRNQRGNRGRSALSRPRSRPARRLTSTGGGGSASLPPLVAESTCSVIRKHVERGSVRVHVASGEADGVAVALANSLGCYLIGNDSDYYIYHIDKGYIPLHFLSPARDNEGPITCRVYKWKKFVDSLKLSSPDFGLITIPALIGNDVIERLPVAGWDMSDAISFLEKNAYSKSRGRYSQSKFEYHLEHDNLQGKSILKQYRQNREKAEKIYEDLCHSTDDITFKTFDKEPVPKWMLQSFQEHKLTNDVLEVLVTSERLLHIVPEDFSLPSVKAFSQPIRQVVYGLLSKGQDVQEKFKEIIREGCKLQKQVVLSKRQQLSIHGMDRVSEEERINTLCGVLQCDPSTLASFDQKWYIPIASLCYWAKEADISTKNMKLKALVLCFACNEYDQELPYKETDELIDISSLHLYTQWQCAYYDSIQLNQVLAHPLPISKSPAALFNGDFIVFYSDKKPKEFDSCIDECTIEVRELFQKIMRVIDNNQCADTVKV